MNPALAHALQLTAACLATAALLHARTLWPAAVAATIAVGLVVRSEALDPAWVTEVVLHDLPWPALGVLALWWTVARLGVVRVRGSGSAALVGATLGDEAVAHGLPSQPADARDRARAVLASSGASLVGPLGGGATLGLGHGGLAAVGLGLAMAAVAAGPGILRDRPRLVRPEASVVWRAVADAATRTLLVAVACGCFVVGGAAAAAADVLTRLELLEPGRHAWQVGLAGLTAGVVGQEAAVAMLAARAFERASDATQPGHLAVFRAALAVGGGLPALLATRSALRIGLPAWAAQVALLFGWIAWSLR
ncbi:MAG: hypothetical protein RLZZ299_3068 [Pseudomonadota bacterium]